MAVSTDRAEHKQSKRPWASFSADPNPLKVLLWFKPADAPRLWDLASRHYPENSEDGSWFAQAARCAQSGLPALMECGTRDQIQEALAFFIRHGIEPPRTEDVRL